MANSLRCVVATRAFEARRSGSIPGRSADETDTHRGGNCWSLHLTLNQAHTGSIPVLGAVARSGAGFQRLTVNEFVAGSIPASHPRENFRWQFPLGRELDCLSSRCGFDSRCHRFANAAFDYWLGRLLLRQQEGDRNSYAVLASIEATKRRGRF